MNRKIALGVLMTMLTFQANAAEKPVAATPAAAPTAAATPATGIAGTWRGALDAGGVTLRLVLEVRETDGKLGAELTSVDQGNVKIPVTSISSDPAGAHFECAAISGSFEGKYSADGSEIAGTWKQGPNSLPLTFKRQP